jgi:hypothetical protein
MELPWELGNFGIPEGSFYAMSCGSGPHWANTTLYDVSGNVVIRGEGAEETGFPLASWLWGFALGISGKALPLYTSVDAAVMNRVLHIWKAEVKQDGDTLEVL